MKYSTFNNIWRACVPHIKIASPREDVCATCERLRKDVSDALEEEEKLASAEALRQHIITAQKERDAYNKCVKRANGSDLLTVLIFLFTILYLLPAYFSTTP